ncbi:group XIIA secretory phospholipase A2 isoform X1 [Strix aluco]|uniref:group XIIA secretory phospholipase A2 isoform X1 n=1 Tax=Strix aluco TaxID=111821 RepID=UPI003DA583B2
MARALLLLAACAWLGPRPARCQEAPHTPDWRMTLKTIRNGVHKIDVYLNAALDLLGGEDGLCRYKCSDGSKPFPRYGYKPSPPNGCGSPLFGVQFDIGIPSMTKCCNHHDRCYDTCGNKKNDCDEQFQSCLSKICRDVQKTLGISESVQELKKLRITLEFHGWNPKSLLAPMRGMVKVLIQSPSSGCFAFLNDLNNSSVSTIKFPSSNRNSDTSIMLFPKIPTYGGATATI